MEAFPINGVGQGCMDTTSSPVNEENLDAEKGNGREDFSCTTGQKRIFLICTKGG